MHQKEKHSSFIISDFATKSYIYPVWASIGNRHQQIQTVCKNMFLMLPSISVMSEVTPVQCLYLSNTKNRCIKSYPHK